MLDGFPIFDAVSQFLRQQGPISAIRFISDNPYRNQLIRDRKHIIKAERADHLAVGSYDEKIVRLLLFIGCNRHIIVHSVDLKNNSAKKFRLALCTIIHIGYAAKASLFLFHIFQKIHISQIDGIKIKLVHNSLSIRTRGTTSIAPLAIITTAKAVVRLS